MLNLSSFFRNCLYLPLSAHRIRGSKLRSVQTNQTLSRSCLLLGALNSLARISTLCAHVKNTTMVDRRKVLARHFRHSKKPTPQSQVFPFLKLPLEIRIIIYQYAIANGALKPTRRRLPSLFHTNLQITREIYRYCALFATYDVKFPNFPRTRLSQLPGYSLVPYLLYKAPQAIALLVLNRQLKNILREAQRYAAHQDRKGLETFIRTRCVNCDGLEQRRMSRHCWSCRDIVAYERWQDIWRGAGFGSLIKHY